MTNRRTLRVAFALGAIALVLALPRLVDASADEPAPPTDAGRALPVETERVEAADHFRTRRSYSGRIEARRVAELAFERVGLLVGVLVDEGGAVKAGDAVARLDARDLELERASAEAERDQANAKLRELQAGPREQTIAAAREVVRDLEAQEEMARRKLDRRMQLEKADGNALSVEALEEARFARASAHARLVRARAVLEELEEGTRAEELDAQRALVARLEARVATIRLAIEKCTLRAPFDGTVSERRADEGSVLSPAQPVVVLVEGGELEARIGLTPDDATSLAPGDQVRVTVGTRAYEAVLRARAPQLDEATRTRLHVFRLLAPDAEVLRGQIVRLEREVSVVADGIWVPHGALVRAPRGLWACYVVEDGRVARREVTIVHADGARAYVRGTLKPGERLIRSGAHRVVAGQRVRAEG